MMPPTAGWVFLYHWAVELSPHSHTDHPDLDNSSLTLSIMGCVELIVRTYQPAWHVMMKACSLNSGIEARGWGGVHGQLWLHTKSEASLGCMRCCPPLPRGNMEHAWLQSPGSFSASYCSVTHQETEQQLCILLHLDTSSSCFTFPGTHGNLLKAFLKLKTKCQ